MRRKKVSSEEKDPSLGDGWSFYVQVAAYYTYLAQHWNEKQPVMSLCARVVAKAD
jgi:hypothetical protein